MAVIIYIYLLISVISGDRNIFIVFALLILAVSGYHDAYMVITKKEVKPVLSVFGSMYIPAVAVIILVGFFFFNALETYNAQIPDGVYCLEVKVERGTKVYTLPVGATKYTESYEDADGYDYYVDMFFLGRAYWPNGGYMDFSGYDPVAIGDRFWYEDSDGRESHITLLGNERHHPAIQTFQSPKKISGLVEAGILSLGALLESIIAIFIQKKKPAPSY